MARNHISIKLKRDGFYKARGGTAQALRLTCGRCGGYICLYQKDGTGHLYRLYWDRIFECVSLHPYRPDLTKDDMEPLICERCDQLLGVPMVYTPESRLAWRLAPGAIHKSRLKG